MECAFTAEVGGEGLEFWQFIGHLGKGAIIGEHSIVWNGGKPSRFYLQEVKLLVLFEAVGKSVSAEIDREQVAGFHPLREILRTVIQKPCPRVLEKTEGMNSKMLAERVPWLNKFGRRHLTWLPAKRLDRQTEHCPSVNGILEPNLKLEGMPFLAPDSKNMRRDEFTLPALKILGELPANKAGNKDRKIGKNVWHGCDYLAGCLNFIFWIFVMRAAASDIAQRLVLTVPDSP